MKNLITILISVLLVFTMQANAQHLEQIYQKTIQFDKALAAAGPGSNYFAEQIDVEKYWHPIRNYPTLIGATNQDSVWVLDLISNIYNGADSGNVLVSLGVSAMNVDITAGYAGHQLDSILIPTDTCCYDTSQSTSKWLTDLAPTICAAADTALLHAALSTDRTATLAAKRLTSATPSRYLYIRYRDIVGNSHYNVIRHRISAVRYPD